MSAEPLDPLYDPKTRRSAAPAEPVGDWAEEDMALVISERDERRGRVLMMKLAGATFSTIAHRESISVSTARKDYDIALSAHMRDTPEVGIARQKAIITDILRANYPRMMDGDKDAAATILKALDREAKLGGYDAPTRVLASVSNEDFARESARLINRIQQIDSNTLKELTRAGHQPPPQPEREPLDVEIVDGAPADQAVAGAPSPGLAGEPDGDPETWIDPGGDQPAEHSGRGGEAVQPDAGAQDQRGGDNAGGVESDAGAGHDGAAEILDGWSNIDDID